ncbi:MAG: hypothetical protein ACO3RU_13275, partial [Planctomycetota bacterium]
VAVLLATHDVGFAARLDACALHLDGDGRLCAGWPPRPAFPSAPPVDAAAPVVLAAHALGVVVRGRPLLESASLAVRAGERLAVRGPSGAGQTPRALAARPAALILDEPTAGLDRVAAVQVVETLLDVQRRHGLALLWITHDEDLAAAVSGQATVHIQRGRTC